MRVKNEPEASAQVIAQVTDAFCVWAGSRGYDTVQNSFGGCEFRKPFLHGHLTLEFEMGWHKKSWRLKVAGSTVYALWLEKELAYIRFRTTPSRLNPSEPLRWLLTPHDDEQTIQTRLEEIALCCERTLLPFLEATATPSGLLEFLLTEHNGLKLISPRITGPYRYAALVAKLLPEQEQPSIQQRLAIAAEGALAAWDTAIQRQTGFS